MRVVEYYSDVFREYPCFIAELYDRELTCDINQIVAIAASMWILFGLIRLDDFSFRVISENAALAFLAGHFDKLCRDRLRSGVFT